MAPWWTKRHKRALLASILAVAGYSLLTSAREMFMIALGFAFGFSLFVAVVFFVILGVVLPIIDRLKSAITG